MPKQIAGKRADQKPRPKADAGADAEAEVLTRRHRQEWVQVAGLRQEALAVRQKNSGEAYQLARLAKITAETTAIQQAGERKAWGLDSKPVDAPQVTPQELAGPMAGGLTDEEFNAIARRISH